MFIRVRGDKLDLAFSSPWEHVIPEGVLINK